MMLDFDFTPIWTAVIALGIYYPQVKIFARCRHIENHRRGIVEITVTDHDDVELCVDSFVVPVEGLVDTIDYGDYIRARLESLNCLPLR